MDYKDYYKIMGVDRDANHDDIKRSYRKLARKYHPDVSKEKNAEDKFKEVGEAYEVLKDPEKRAAYDQLGANWQAGQDFQPPPDWDAGFEFSGGGYTQADNVAFSDFFETLFGQGFGSSRGKRAYQGYQARGEDHHAKVLIDLEDSYQGTEREITLRTPIIDNDGRVINKERKLSVKIPKGVKQGQKVRLVGQGSPGIAGGEPGDLFLEIEFKPHGIYHVEGKDVYLDLPVTPWEAALGANVKIPTPLGKLDLKIPSNSSGGRKLRLKGQGIPGASPGDIYVTLRVMLPPAESETAKKLYREMEQKLAFNPRVELGV
ncbi:MAG: DnaJ C-terminal domain-containing protein [Gammaproteobacteria bacterium]